MPTSGSPPQDVTVEEVKTWTNADVIRWLLTRDLKQFVGAAIENNVVGAELVLVEVACLLAL